MLRISFLCLSLLIDHIYFDLNKHSIYYMCEVINRTNFGQKIDIPRQFSALTFLKYQQFSS